MSPLRGHKDEIWFADFSNDGKKVASASKDKTAIVWSLDTGTVKCVLIGHEDAISFLKWSPDDSMILTCGRDRSLKLWDAEVIHSLSYIVFFLFFFFLGKLNKVKIE